MTATHGSRANVSLLGLALSLNAAGALAQATAPAQPPLEEVVVTGFRQSLDAALDIKRQQAVMVDAIVAEDIAKFPDKNLAESLQRVPGIALDRGDGGEGKRISVRGLSADFTRVRLNGMEAAALTGSSDAEGGTNRTRSFDFNVLPSELFSSLTVRKTPSAEVEEGSLGATVDLAIPRPLDYKDDMTLALSAQSSYNDMAREFDPRGTVLFSKKLVDNTFGVTTAVAYSKRRTLEEGAGTVIGLRPVDDGGFCSPVGYASPNPPSNPTKGTDALDCGTGVPRTSNPAAYDRIANRTDVFHPRQARFVHSEQEYERLGAIASLQWAPDDETNIALDTLYSRFDVDRSDNFITPISFGRALGNNGKPHTSVLEAQIAADGFWEYGRFNGVDLRSESVTDRYVSTIEQAVLSAGRTLSDRFAIDGLVGFTRSDLDQPVRTTITLDAVNTNNFSWDYRGGRRIPLIDYGVDITDPNAFAFGPGRADGTVTGILGVVENEVRNDFLTANLNATATFTDAFKLRFGGQYRDGDFTSRQAQRATTVSGITPSLPAGTSLANLTRQIDDFGRGLGGDVPSGWVAADYDRFNEVFGLESNTGVFELVGIGPNSQALGSNFSVNEQVTGGFVQMDFETNLLPFTTRGNLGVRYVRTDVETTGYVILPAPLFFQAAVIERTYDDLLPSLNLAAEITPDFQLRLSGARVMSRPPLSLLNPGGTISTVSRGLSIGNPNLDPVRANTLDLAAEYYFGTGGLVSLGLFYKDIESTVQVVRRLVPFSETGLPPSILQGSQATPDDLFQVTRAVNAKGGPLEGFEINYQQPFTFLPGFLSKLGALVNYVQVSSEVDYVVGANADQTVTTDLAGLSKHSANGTLYYDDGKFSIRASLNYRSGYLVTVPSGGPGSDVDGVRSSIFVDASSSYAVTDRLRLTLEAQNLTNEWTAQYSDSRRKDPLYQTLTGRTYTMGASYRF